MENFRKKTFLRSAGIREFCAVIVGGILAG